MMMRRRLKQILIIKRGRKRLMKIIIKTMMKMKKRKKMNISLSLEVLKRRVNLKLSMWNSN